MHCLSHHPRLILYYSVVFPLSLESGCLVARVVRIVSILSVVGLALLIPACGKGGGGKTKIAVVTNCTHDFWSFAEAGAKKAGQDFDVEVLFRQPTNMAVPDQMDIISAFQQQGVKGIAVSVIDPKEQTPDLSRIAKEMPLIAMDNDAPASGRLCYIGIDNYEGGKAAGRLLKSAMPNGGTIGIFIGSTTSANGQARTQGVLDELAGEKDAKGVAGKHPAKPKIDVKTYGKFHLVDGGPKTDDGKSTEAQNNAQDVMSRLTDVPGDIGMIGLYAYNPPAILLAPARKDLGDRLKIVGFDEDWETLKAINAGSIVGSIVQDPFQYGYKSVEILAAAAKGDQSKVLKEAIPYRVVTKDGGPEQTINGLKVQNLKASEIESKLRADLASVKK